VFQTWFANGLGTRILTVSVVLLAGVSWGQIEKGAKAPTIRWSEGQPGCTFSGDDDGKYRYGLWTDDFGIVVAVDALELQKSRRRLEALFTLHLTIRYRGKDSIAVEPEGATLEFVDHSHTIQSAVDPQSLSGRLQDKADAFIAQTERTLSEHPERAAATQSELNHYQRTIADTREFLRSQALRSSKLDASHTDASGWIVFSAGGKWIGEWKKQERFELRVPLGARIVEFPFALPPSRGDLLLRRRP